MNRPSPDDMKAINEASKKADEKKCSIDWFKLWASILVVLLWLIAVAVVIWLIILTKWWIMTVWFFCLAVYIVYDNMDDY